MTSVTLPDLSNLSVDQKLKLIDTIWDSIGDFGQSFPISEELKNELRQSHEEYLRDPSQAKTWEETKAWILNREARTQNPN